MIRSAFYILILSVVSVIRTTQNSYLDSIPSLGEWIPSSLNCENEPVAEAKTGEVPNVKSPQFVDAPHSNKDIKDVVNHDRPLPVDNLLEQLIEEESKVKSSDDQHKSELVGISQQIGTALYDNSIGKVNVLMKGSWHNVDLGLAGSPERKRSVKKANGIMKTLLNGLKELGKWFCGLIVCCEPDGGSITAEHNNVPGDERFDARKAWSECENIISLIRDQGYVGSCWAVAAAFMLSDRLCIASEGKYQQPLSSEDLMRCCPTCARLNNGVVVGGNMDDVMSFLQYKGIVSGGEYGSEKGCIPYSYPPRMHPDNSRERQKNAECDKTCSNTDYKTPYHQDKYYIDGFKKYEMPEDLAAIKADLQANGPCIATMREYTDFYEPFENGIYTHRSGKYLTQHIIRVIGFGKQNGIEYWLVANSRGKNWGEKGVGKISMASGCDFGEHVWCFNPKIPDTSNDEAIPKLD